MVESGDKQCKWLKRKAGERERERERETLVDAIEEKDGTETLWIMRL
jgi:hypothetical protein